MEETASHSDAYSDIDFGIKEEEINEDKVIFKVQIDTDSKLIPLDDAKFKGLPVKMYQDNGLYKYTVGAYYTFDEANLLKNTMRELGFEHAFVIAFHEKNRISLEKAIKLAKN